MAATDWITASATGATAIATAVAAFAAWRTLRRDAKSVLPVVEASLYWGNPDLGRHVCVHLVIRNVIYETLVIEAATVLIPRRALLSSTLVKPDVNGRATAIEIGKSAKLSLGWKVPPFGTERKAPSMLSAYVGRSDVFVGDLYVTPPEKWEGGEIKLTLRLSSKGRTIRDKSIPIVQSIGRRPAGTDSP